MATANPIIISSPPMAMWQLKPVLGPGREDRLQAVERFLENNPSKKTLLEDIHAQVNKCRVLYEKGDASNVPHGLLIYRDSLSSSYSDLGFQKALVIKVLSTISQTTDQMAAARLCVLLDEASDEAKEREADSICLTLPRVETVAYQFLKQKGFRDVTDRQSAEVGNYLMGFDLQAHRPSTAEPSLSQTKAHADKKRRRDEEVTPEQQPSETPAVSKALNSLVKPQKRSLTYFANKELGPKKAKLSNGQSASSQQSQLSSLEVLESLMVDAQETQNRIVAADKQRKEDEEWLKKQRRSAVYPLDEPSQIPTNYYNLQQYQADYTRQDHIPAAAFSNSNNMPYAAAGYSYQNHMPTSSSRQFVNPAPNPNYVSKSGQQPLGVTLRKIYIHAIRDGRKTIEGRINNGMFKNLPVGREMRFFYMANAQDDVVARVIKINYYTSFREMVQKENYKACVPEATSVDHAARLYEAIPGYTEKAQRFGVLAIHIEKIS